MSRLIVQHAKSLRGHIHLPGDKSISHRALLLGAIADGITHVDGILLSGDCVATLRCIRDLGIRVEADANSGAVAIHGKGLYGLRAPGAPLNCERSGTTMRLIAGILAGQPFQSTLSGSSQLLKRPMRRIVDPLRQMNADIQDVAGTAPLTIRGRRLAGFDHTLAVASAQVKSALLLAGLYADGPTIVRQPGPARDHTERLLSAMGITIESRDLAVTLTSPIALTPLRLAVPGDISSAAFLVVAACLVPNSQVTIQHMGVNPTRTGLLDVMQKMNAHIALGNQTQAGPEPVADLTVRDSTLSGVEVGGTTVVRMIDEFPILAVAATQADGATIVRDAAELRVKESDRIECVVQELTDMGANIEARSDGFIVRGPTPLTGSVVRSHGDHRLAMALAVAGLIASGETTVEDAGCIADSYPEFESILQTLGAQLSHRQ